MAPAKILERNVRVPKQRHEDEEDADEGEEYEDMAADDEDAGEGEESGSDMDDEQGRDEEDGDGEDELDGNMEQQVSAISFGALKQAQDAVFRKRKRGSDEAPEQDDKLENLRKRLRQIKEQKTGTQLKPTATTKTSRDDPDNSNSDSDSDSGPSEDEAPSKSRTSKHAPAEQTSRHQVTRKRTVVDYPRRAIRDPRFDSIPNQPSTAHQPPNGTADKAYSFLLDYQRTEIDDLKAALKRAKGEDDIYNLRRKINSMENRLKAHAAKEREQAVRSAHKKEEKGRVLEGKKPYFLKDKEVKERALVEKFRGMKGKEREKVVEKRRLKESQREKRGMPRDRRRVAQ
ncbi:rRNA biogenesis protein rrp36 [Friedmanniomyces endolithicus]|nr:rRNA biogenesis protein rrp36 [Friedmanniomyces endolithicus]KAK0273758.1 rRNA biogenesis protein rrp36 [Friedmanniomyces endolithicus]KAK1015193.1 rRNA biogenesis protein rrp36 [Friedmanniomyces endolithicus]